jgi:SAM-dependent methyltransferase
VLDAIGSLRLDPRDVVDVGCGTGAFLDELGRTFPRADVLGVEPSAAAREVAQEAGRRVVEGSFQPLPLADASVDLLVALDVLEHCADEAGALSEARRAVRPGGGMVLTVPALPSLWSSHDRLNNHRCRYVREELVGAVTRAGFEVGRCSYFNTLMLPLAYLARALPERAGREGASGIRIPVAPVNALLRGIFGLERPMLRHWDLPTGVSLIITARRP